MLRIDSQNRVDTIAADALAPCIGRLSAIMVLNIVECHYNSVEYIMILHKPLQWQQ